MVSLRGVYTGAAWLSSARAVRCWVKSRNERNPCCLLPAFRMGTQTVLPVTNRRKVGMTSNHHGPYVLGYTGATMVGTERCKTARWSKSQKAGLSTDWSLKLDFMKLESLVIAHQHGAVIRSRALYTPPVTPPELGVPEVARLTGYGGRCRRYAW